MTHFFEGNLVSIPIGFAVAMIWPIFGFGANVSHPPATPDGSPRFSLQDYVWKNRVVLVFTPSRDTEAYLQFRRQWDRQLEATIERDLLLVECVEQGTSRFEQRDLPSSVAAHLRTEFEAPLGEFLVVLIGKDGSEKLRSPEIPVAELFDRVDAMPMRRAEMERQRTGQPER